MLKQAGAMHKAAEIQGGFATRFARALAIRILLPGALAADWLSETERPTILPLHLPGALKHRAVRGGLWAIPRSLCALILFGLSPVLSIAATGCAAQRAESKLTQRDSTFGSAPLRVSSPEAPSSETPTEGQEVLRDATAMEPGIADEVRKNGTPDAVEVHSRELAANEPAGRKEFFIALYYKRPSQTLLYRERRETLFLYTFDQVLNISEVPRSVRRQAFREGPMPPPWPVTISRTATFPEILGGLPLPQAVNIADAFGAPMCPAAATPPSVGEDSTAYAAISDGIRKGIAQIHRGASFDRGSRAFARIDPAARLSGFNWTLVMFHSSGNYAFTVPDGSIFLSDGLIEQLSDDEVVAVIAHLIGHEAYGHDRSFWMVASPAEKAGATIGIAVLVAALIFVTKGTALKPMLSSSGPYEHFTIYSRENEVEANCAAAGYLASVGIPPDTLFDAMLKLSIASRPVDSIQHYRVSESADFAHLHTADRSAADLGKMLDTGALSSPATNNAIRHATHLAHNVAAKQIRCSTDLSTASRPFELSP